MDIFAHGLWSGAAYAALNKKKEKNGLIKFKVRWAVFWGVFPDLFAFTIPFAIIFWNIFAGNLQTSDFPRPNNTEPPEATALLVMDIASRLYNFSHSIIIFSGVFVVIYIINKKPPMELLAWLGHIFIDIPTHTSQFFPTPIFWPVFGWRFDGFSWSEPWFVAVNYGSLLLIYLILNKGVFHIRHISKK